VVQWSQFWNIKGRSTSIYCLPKLRLTSKDLFLYKWGDARLILTEPAEGENNLFELDSRDILLFKRHPEATSARNLLECTVTDIYSSGNRVRVELVCGNEHLIAQIVPESVHELGIEEGALVVAAIKASAFKKIS
jgi:molybdate transport system ATP-binding protein